MTSRAVRAGGSATSSVAGSGAGHALALTLAAALPESSTSEPDLPVLVLYTDGVVEARDDAKRLFGTERLIEAARRPAGSAAEIRENVLDALARHVGATPVEADVTLVVARGVAIEEAS